MRGIEAVGVQLGVQIGLRAPRRGARSATMAEDVVDVSVLGGYAALHERERAAASGARFVRRHARWDPAWSVQ